MDVLPADRRREHREIVAVVPDVPRAGAGVAGELVNGQEGRTGLLQENRLGPIAVMHVKIKDRDAFGPSGHCFEGGNRDVVQVTEAHRPVARRVVPRRAH